jgi:transposase
VPLAAGAGLHAQKKTLIAREQDAQARAVWWVQMAGVPPEQLVFLDETSTSLGLTPLRGRAPRGQRLVGRIPRGRWTNVTLLATLTMEGLGPGLQFAGALDRSIFEQFVETVLVPRLRPGQVVVLDNLSVHKSAHARQRIEAAGCHLVFLPTYSPDCNPIEQIFAKLKQALRRAEARTVEAIMTATQQAFAQITAADSRGCFRAAGYNL